MRRMLTSTAARLCRIEQMLRRRSGVTLAAMLRELETSPATLKRDLQCLRATLDAPVSYDHESRRYSFAAPWPGVAYVIAQEAAAATGAAEQCKEAARG